MARLFNDALSEYLRHAAAVVSGVPFAMACWFNLDDAGVSSILMSIDNGNNELYILHARKSIADAVAAMAYSGEWEIALTTTGITVDQWHHACAIFPSDTDRYAYIDGGSKGTHPGTESVGTVTQTVIGSYKSLTSGFMSGMIAEAAIWDLSNWPGATGADKAAAFEKILPSLAKGFSPLFFPLGLKAYWPLVRNLKDKVTGYVLTPSGTSVIEHCKIILPIGQQLTPTMVQIYTEIPPFMQKDLIDPYSGGAWLWLFEISVPGYKTQRQARNTEDIIYGGTNFPKGNFEPPKQSFSGDSSIPQIALRVAQDPEHTLEDIVNATKGGADGTVKLIRTCEKFLDSPVAELEAEYDILTAGSDVKWVTFTLGIPNPLTQRIPLWLYSSKVCPLATPSLFKGPRCQYVGGDTVCTGLLEDCYAKGNAVHWGAEIGLDPNAVRV